MTPQPINATTEQTQVTQARPTSHRDGTYSEHSHLSLAVFLLGPRCLIRTQQIRLETVIIGYRRRVAQSV